MHLRDALGRFTLQLQADGRSPHTIGQYERHGRLLITWLATERLSCEVEDIDHETLAHFLASEVARMRGDGIAKKASSVNALRTSTRVLFGHLHRAGYVASDPARLLRLARCGPPPPRGLSDAEEAKLLAAARSVRGPEGERDTIFLEFALGTGVRISSALALHVEDLDLQEGSALLRRVKGATTQRVWFGTTIRRRLAVYIGARTEGPVFPARHGGHLSARNFQRRFQGLRDAAGLSDSITAHSMRHRFATVLYNRCGDVAVVQSALCHKSIVSTLIYAKAGESRVRAFLPD